MARFTLLFLTLAICFISYSFLNVEAKSQGKNKDKYKKYKTEGNPKEAKHRYSKNSQKSPEPLKRKEESVEEENVDLGGEGEDESPERPINQNQEVNSKEQKKEKKPYRISVELMEEIVPQEARKTNGKNKKSSKIASEERLDLGSKTPKESKQKVKKNKSSQRTAEGNGPASVEEDASDFIVRVPKNKKGKRQVLVFQVPVPEEEEEILGQEIDENAVQNYVSEEQDAAINEEECNCEGSTEEEESTYEEAPSNMCYYKNTKK